MYILLTSVLLERTLVPLPRKDFLQAEHEARLVIIAPTRALCATCLVHVDASWGTWGEGSVRIAHLAFSLDIARIDLWPSAHPL